LSFANKRVAEVVCLSEAMFPAAVAHYGIMILPNIPSDGKIDKIWCTCAEFFLKLFCNFNPVFLVFRILKN
jgi:hypothetical protein